jgi:NTE family protein
MSVQTATHNKIRLGYALGGGAARGLFHIGVLNVLEEFGIVPDIVVGTSMGAVVGALYAGGLKASEIKQIALQIDWTQTIRFASLPIVGLVQDKWIMNLLKSVLQDTKFSHLKIKFACVATDLDTGKQVVLNSGSLVEAVRASIAIPGVFAPARIGKRYLVDGGLVNVVPVSVCHDMGATFTIGVNVIPDPAAGDGLKKENAALFSEDFDDLNKPIVPEANVVFRNRVLKIDTAIRHFASRPRPTLKELIKKSPSLLVQAPKLLLKDRPNVVDVVSQSINIVEYFIAMENLKTANMVITPSRETIGLWQFHRAADAIAAGEETTREALRMDDVARIILSDNRIVGARGIH